LDAPGKGNSSKRRVEERNHNLARRCPRKELRTLPGKPNKRPAIAPSLSVYEVADLFGLSHKTIRNMIRDGKLPAAKIGQQWRIRPEVVSEMLGIPA
jgi:excisionase family DNA binding protein